MEILLIENNHRTLDRFVNYFRNDKVFRIIAFTEDTEYGVDCIYKIKPQVVILDVSSDSKALDYVESLNGLGSDIKGMVIVGKSNDGTVLRAYRLGFDSVITLPLDFIKIRLKLKELYAEEAQISFSRLGVEARVKRILNETGISNHLNGYRYLRDAIVLCYRDEKMLESITKVLYPYLAKEFVSTAATVEKCMRTAIDFAWKHSGGNDFYRRTGCNLHPNNEKPTNREFISAVVEWLRMEM